MEIHPNAVRRLLIFFGVVVIALMAMYIRILAMERAVWKEILHHAAATPAAAVRCADPAAGVGVTGEFCRWEHASRVDPGVRAALGDAPTAESRHWVEHVLAHGWPDAVWATLEALEERAGDDWAARIVERFSTHPDRIREVYARHAIVVREAGVPRRQITREWISNLGDLDAPVGRYGRRLPEGHFAFGGLLASWWKVKYWERIEVSGASSEG